MTSFHLCDHVADKDDKGDGEGDDEPKVDVLCSETGFSIVFFFFAFLLKCFLLFVLQWVDLLTVVDYLFVKVLYLKEKYESATSHSINSHPNHHLSMHVGLPNLDSGGPLSPVDPLELQLALPQEVDEDVDQDVDRRADQEEQQPHVNELR